MSACEQKSTMSAATLPVIVTPSSRPRAVPLIASLPPPRAVAP
jgi:hypothetical protein